MKKEAHKDSIEKIIQAIDKGVKPWVAPFGRPTLRRAENFFTKTKYQGVNSILLLMEAYAEGFSSNAWLTFKQISALKGKVRKGEASKRIFFFTYVEKKDAETKQVNPDKEVELVPRWKYFNVFNVDQTEGLVLPETKNLAEGNPLSNISVDDFVLQTKAEIQHSDKKAAFYSPGFDLIHLPYQKHFHSVEAYYATLLHELVHWTGHRKRLDRLQAGNRFGDKAYAFEELVAELGSTFLSTDLNVHADIENHASYLASWSQLLNDKHMAFFKAAALAEKAVQYLHDFNAQQSGKQLDLLNQAA